jgi:deoxyadenosine/deoxycytidine kinase
LDNSKYKLSVAMIDSCDVSDLWLKKTLNSLAISDSKSSNDESQEYDNQSVSPTSVIDSIFEMKTNKEFKKDFKIIDSSSVLKFCKYFFSCDPMAIEEEIKILSNQENSRSSTNSSLSISPILISLEGNIGAGKSYLLSALRQLHPEWVFIDEPVSFWQSLKNDNNESLLEVFYKDQSRWSYTFQNCALLSRFSNIETTVTDYSNKISQENISNGKNDNNIRKPVVFITERCLDTDHEVFAKMLHADGQLDSLEFDLYERWFALLMQTATPLSAIVYVDTVPNTCSDRIRMRNRDGEDSIPLAYLSSLDLFQRKWIDSTNVPVIRTVSDDNQKVTNFVESLVSEAINKQLC